MSYSQLVGHSNELAKDGGCMVKKEKKKGRAKELWKNCVKCGGRFLAKKKDQKYCSDTCRQEYYEEHYFIKKQEDKVCPQCGETFTTSMPRKQTYCKPECREDAAKVRVGKTVEQRDAERATYIGDRYATLEKDKFRCTICGRGANDGARLEVAEEEGQLRTMCVECREGKKLSER